MRTWVVLFLALGAGLGFLSNGLASDVLQAARERSVVVRFYVRPNPEDAPGESGYLPSRGTYQTFIDEERPVEVPGAILDEKRVLIADFGFDDRYLDYLEVETFGGDRIRARCLGILTRASAMVLTPAAEGICFGSVPTFADDEIGEGRELCGLKMHRADGGWQVVSYPLNPVIRFNGDRGCRGILYTGFKGQDCNLVGAKNGKILGCAFSYFIDAAQRESVWKGKDLAEAEMVPYEELVQLRRAAAEQFGGLFAQVIIEFREELSAKFDGRGSFLSLTCRRPGGPARQLRTYGIPVTHESFFVPVGIGRREAASIGRVRLKICGKEVAAEVLGAYKEFEGFLVKSKQAVVPLPYSHDSRLPKKNEPFVCLNVEQKFGGLRVEAYHNRYLYFGTGFRNRSVPVPLRDMVPGAFLLDIFGRPMGVYLRERKDDEEKQWIQETAHRGYSRPTPEKSRLRVYSLTELESYFARPEKHFDRDIVVLSAEEEKKRAWLGVEFVRMSMALAKQLGCERETKDGRTGLLVGNVYANSPGDRMGLKPGDILLEIREKGRKLPTELSAPARLDLESFDLGHSATLKGLAGLGARVQPPPWRSRENYLTLLLDAVGIGENVTLRYLRQGRTLADQFTIERAPADFDSAPKFKDEALGLTVKDLTYEVRLALNVRGKEGVVVAAVDSGSPTAVAKINPYEVLTSANGRSVTSAAHFGNIVKGARKGGKKTIKVVVLSLGQSRIVDLSLQ